MASHRRPAQPGLVRVGRVTVLTAAAAAALSAAVPAGAAPRESPREIQSRVKALYAQAEAATQQYDAARATGDRLRSQLSALQGESARDQQSVNKLRGALAEIAGDQYRAGGIDPALTLILSSDPDSYLDRASTLDRIQGQRADQVLRLRAAQRTLDAERARAGADLARLDGVRARLADRKRVIQRKLAAAQRLLAALGPAQRAALGYGTAAAGRTALAGAVPDLPDLPAPSARAAEAVAAARSVLGAPYSWGSTGPDAFDCSGLTYWAYQHAGVTLPRTSQEQLHAGRRVPLSQARPGDLVVYRDDASHVALYVGGGRVIHAPYPGARVRYDPVDMLPIDGVVRP
jgi:cell wall-associated NlpC family hydrolase